MRRRVQTYRMPRLIYFFNILYIPAFDYEKGRLDAVFTEYIENFKRFIRWAVIKCEVANAPSVGLARLLGVEIGE